MPHPNAPYPLIRGNLQALFDKLLAFPISPFWIHESVISNFIGMPKGKGEYGQSEGLTVLLACIKRGFGVSKRVKELLMGVGEDIEDQSNPLGFCFQYWGAKESFQKGDLSVDYRTAHPRWFHFGPDFSMEVKQQVIIVKNLTGDCTIGQLADVDPAVLPMY